MVGESLLLLLPTDMGGDECKDFNVLHRCQSSAYSQPQLLVGQVPKSSMGVSIGGQLRPAHARCSEGMVLDREARDAHATRPDTDVQAGCVSTVWLQT